MVDRVLQNTPATLTATWSVDGVATDPTPQTVTVDVFRANGTQIVTAAAATRTGTGVYALELDTANTALLDQLTARWTSSLGALTTTIEVVGGFLFSTAQAQQVPALSGLTAGQLRQLRTSVEQLIEDQLEVAFVPRYAREALVGTGSVVLPLSQPRVRAIRSATVDGIALDAAAVTVGYRAAVTQVGWATGSAVVVEYEHGYDRPPQPVTDGALLIAEARAPAASDAVRVDPRVTRVTTPEGTMIYGGGRFGHHDAEVLLAPYEAASAPRLT